MKTCTGPAGHLDLLGSQHWEWKGAQSTPLTHKRCLIDNCSQIETDFFLTEFHWVCKPLWQSGIIRRGRWVTQNKYNDIFGISLCCNALSRPFTFSDLTSPLHRYYGFSFYVFVGFPCVWMYVSVCLWKGEWRKMYYSLKTIKIFFLDSFYFVCFFLSTFTLFLLLWF